MLNLFIFTDDVTFIRVDYVHKNRVVCTKAAGQCSEIINLDKGF